MNEKVSDCMKVAYKCVNYNKMVTYNSLDIIPMACPVGTGSSAVSLCRLLADT